MHTKYLPPNTIFSPLYCAKAGLGRYSFDCCCGSIEHSIHMVIRIDYILHRYHEMVLSIPIEKPSNFRYRLLYALKYIFNKPLPRGLGGESAFCAELPTEIIPKFLALLRAFQMEALELNCNGISIDSYSSAYDIEPPCFLNEPVKNKLSWLARVNRIYRNKLSDFYETLYIQSNFRLKPLAKLSLILRQSEPIAYNYEIQTFTDIKSKKIPKALVITKAKPKIQYSAAAVYIGWTYPSDICIFKKVWLAFKYCFIPLKRSKKYEEFDFNVFEVSRLIRTVADIS